jgi:hypothetical protein
MKLKIFKLTLKYSDQILNDQTQKINVIEKNILIKRLALARKDCAMFYHTSKRIN